MSITLHSVPKFYSLVGCTLALGATSLAAQDAVNASSSLLARLSEKELVELDKLEITSGRAQDAYLIERSRTATKTETPLLDVPQSISVVTQQQITDQQMLSIADVVRYVPGVSSHQGENNRDQLIFRGNSSSADFFYNGVRDDVQYYRDLYNLDRVEILRGPNAMIFGRGGGGGVINRVTKEAVFNPVRSLTAQAGSFGGVRASLDLDQPLSDTFAARLNVMYERSDSFRDFVNLQRSGLNPTLTFAPSQNTKITASYEHLHDTRVADRGITSFQGRPAEIDLSTFYGNPKDSHVYADVDLWSASLSHDFGHAQLRTTTTYGDYDRSYQNYVPGVVSADRTTVRLSAYNNATTRRNLFNQTDLTYSLYSGPIQHTFLTGVEWGAQRTDNFRNTGYFNNTDTALQVDYAAPTTTVPVTFRQSATDADNHLKTALAAAYFQDQIDLTPQLLAILGVRFDSFDLKYHNNRNGSELTRKDELLSPRVGLVFKPIPAASLYASYSVSFLPSSGDQFSSLTTVTQQVKPEKFRNKEVGLKWDLPHKLSLTSAVYQLDRDNTRATDPNDPTRIVQTGSQRTNGFELGLSGQLTKAWSLAGGYAYQDASIRSATTAAKAGAQVGQVPHHNFSVWNKYQVNRKLGFAVGLVYRSQMYATVDNTVTLPGYTRFDAAIFYSLSQSCRLQLNVENVFDKKYYANADSNTNISPGSPRALRAGIVLTF